MAEACEQVDSRSRKNLSTILKALANVGQVRVAEAIGKDESTVSKMKDKDLPQLARILAACGLKVVPESVRCFDPRQIEAILHLAKARLAEIENSDQLGLAWEE